MHELGDCGAAWLDYDMDACCAPLVGSEHPAHSHDGISSVLDLRLEAGASADSDSGLSGDSWGVFGNAVSSSPQHDCLLMGFASLHHELRGQWAAE